MIGTNFWLQKRSVVLKDEFTAFCHSTEKRCSLIILGCAAPWQPMTQLNKAGQDLSLVWITTHFKRGKKPIRYDWSENNFILITEEVSIQYCKDEFTALCHSIEKVQPVLSMYHFHDSQWHNLEDQDFWTTTTTTHFLKEKKSSAMIEAKTRITKEVKWYTQGWVHITLPLHREGTGRCGKRKEVGTMRCDYPFKIEGIGTARCDPRFKRTRNVHL